MMTRNMKMVSERSGCMTMEVDVGNNFAFLHGHDPVDGFRELSQFSPLALSASK